MSTPHRLSQNRIRHHSHQKEAPTLVTAWPTLSIYSKIAEEEDNRMTDRWQKDTEGILIFVSAAFKLY
jgi:hypothetical protein